MQYNRDHDSHLDGEQVQDLQLSTAIKHISVIYVRLTMLQVPPNSTGIANVIT